jgi:MFS family permease
MPDPTDMAGAPPVDPSRMPSLLRSVNFRKYIAVLLTNSFSIQLITLTVGWQVYELTRNPLDLGLVGLSQAAPIFLLFLVAGLAADRLNRRAVLASCNTIHALLAAALLYFATTGVDAPWPIFLILFIHGSARALYEPSLMSILPSLVDKKQFPTAIAYVTSLERVAQIAGPLTAGVLIALIGAWVYLIAIVCFLVAALCAALITQPPRERIPRAVRLADLVSGFSYVWSNKLVLAVMSMDLVAILFSGILGMLPAIARDVLHVGPEGLGILRTMPAVGAIMVGLVLTQIPLKNNVGRTLIGACMAIGLSVIAFSLSEIFWLSLLILAFYGAADMFSTNIRHTLVQLVTPDDMRGRVASVHSVTAGTSDDIGDFRAGASAAVIGLSPAIALGGLVTIFLSLSWWWIFPAMRDVNMYGERGGKAE